MESAVHEEKMNKREKCIDVDRQNIGWLEGALKGAKTVKQIRAWYAKQSDKKVEAIFKE